jgi:hypothetical protein
MQQWVVSTYAGEGTVVPEVTLVGEAVADETELALLGVLLDGVQELVLGDLDVGFAISIVVETIGVMGWYAGQLACRRMAMGLIVPPA